jgi:hypothetical protein
MSRIALTPKETREMPVTLEDLEKRVAKLENAGLDQPTIQALDRISQSIGEAISRRLAAVFDENIKALDAKVSALDGKMDALDAKIDQSHAEVMAQFEKLRTEPQEH